MSIQLLHGNCLDLLKQLPDNSVDSVVTDPPYGLKFMNKHWDHDVPKVEIWQECLRVLKPGGYLLAFAGTRTQHRMAVNIEDAGFEIRDMIAWCYGSGMPKSLDVSKAIDKAAGVEREITREGQTKAPEDAGKFDSASSAVRERRDEPATDAAREWQGWGTALKPALEPITVARKPLIGTVAENVLTHGTGALNIDASRIPVDPSVDDPRLGGAGTWSSDKMAKNVYEGGYAGERVGSSPLGRYPANFIHDGSEEVVPLFPDSDGAGPSLPNVKITGYGDGAVGTGESKYLGGPRKPFNSGSGSAARFFYCAKASKRDRDEGLEDAPNRILAMSNQAKAELARGNMHEGKSGMNTAKVRKNNHPTVKPTDLMRYLCRLVTPPGGVVLDPFMGSGSTGKGAVLEGFQFIGMEMDANYIKIANRRIHHAAGTPDFLIPEIDTGEAQ